MDRDALAAAGYELSEAEHARLAKYVDLLLAENQRANLTGTREPAALWGLHICDSLALLPLIDGLGATTLLDVGTGGGLPGLPIAAVCPDLRVTVVDSTQKKLAAIERMAAALDITNLNTLWGRAETLAHDRAHRESYDAVTARALGPLPVALELCAGFVRVGGQCWLFRSVQSATDDVVPAQPAADKCYLSHVETRAYALPEPHGQRAFVMYQKDKPLRPSLPREPGRPKSHPLA